MQNRTVSVFRAIVEWLGRTEWYLTFGRLEFMFWRPWRWRYIEVGVAFGLSPNDRLLQLRVCLLILHFEISWDRFPEWSKEVSHVA